MADCDGDLRIDLGSELERFGFGDFRIDLRFSGTQKLLLSLLQTVVRVRHDFAVVRVLVDLLMLRAEQCFPLRSILVIRLLDCSRERTEFKYASMSCSSFIASSCARIVDGVDTSEDFSLINSQHSLWIAFLLLLSVFFESVPWEG